MAAGDARFEQQHPRGGGGRFAAKPAPARRAAGTAGLRAAGDDDRALRYKKDIWSLLIASGGRLPDADRPASRLDDGDTKFYGGCVNSDRDGTAEALAHIRGGIDYARSSDPAEHTARSFAGSFASRDDEIRYLAGTVVCADGFTCRWGASLDGGTFGGVVALLASAPDPADAADELARRLDEIDADTWTYGCNLRPARPRTR